MRSQGEIGGGDLVTLIHRYSIIRYPTEAKMHSSFTKTLTVHLGSQKPNPVIEPLTTPPASPLRDSLVHPFAAATVANTWMHTAASSRKRRKLSYFYNLTII